MKRTAIQTARKSEHQASFVKQV